MPAAAGGRPGPLRTCIGCRRRTTPAHLVRVVRTPDGGLAVGRTLPGRGAWVCPDQECVTRARQRRAWGRALRGPVDAGAVDALLATLDGGEGVAAPG